MKKRLIIFLGTVLLALLLTTGTFAYTYTNSNTALMPTLANGDFATYEVAPNQPDWTLVLPGTSYEILVPNDSTCTTELPTQYPCYGEHWDKVDDQPSPDEGNTYVSTYYYSGYWKKDVYELSDPVGDDTASITGVTVYFRFASTYNGYSVSAKPVIKTDDNLYEGTTVTSSTTDFETYSWDLPANPSTDEPWTWDAIEELRAGIAMKGYSSYKPAICTQVYVKVNYQIGVVESELPQGDLFTVTPEPTFTGDLLVKVYITNVSDLLKAYQYLNMKIYTNNTVEAGKIPNYQILSTENGVVIFSIIGGSASSYTVQLVGGSYNLLPGGPDTWGEGWTLTPEFYCEVTQR